MNTKFTPEEKQAWRAEQRNLPFWREIYGSRNVLVASTLEHEPLYRRIFSLAPGNILRTAPKRGGYFASVDAQSQRQLKRKNECKPVRYLVLGDQSLRHQQRLLRKQFETMTPEQQTKLVNEALARHGKAQEEVAA